MNSQQTFCGLIYNLMFNVINVSFIGTFVNLLKNRVFKVENGKDFAVLNMIRLINASSQININVPF